MARYFIDTNVLVYADDADAPVKRKRAQELIREGLTSGDAVLSTQILQEYFVVATRKLKVSAEAAQKKVELFATMDVVTVGVDVVDDAIKLHRLNAISFWDALVVQCARAAGCTTLFTEDLQDGQVIEGVKVQNPFVATRRT
jgi:predicted nucleic acid-binding protein